MLVTAAAIPGSAFWQTATLDTPAQPARGGLDLAVVPMLSSSPTLGTAAGEPGGYMQMFDLASRVSLVGANYRYTSTHSQISWSTHWHRHCSLTGTIDEDGFAVYEKQRGLRDLTCR